MGWANAICDQDNTRLAGDHRFHSGRMDIPRPIGRLKYSEKTSIQRYCERLSVRHEYRDQIEEEIFREFRRSYHNYSNNVPDRDCTLEWLSIMQHHGAPTRLLDFTYSIWVAAYFALERANGDSAVWALDAHWACDESAEIMRAAGKPQSDKIDSLTKWQEGDEEIVNNLFFKHPYLKIACALNPFRLNERLRIQKGVFVLPGDVTVPFLDNLLALPGQGKLIKIVIPAELCLHGLIQLFEMNISRTSLFPGLDGYAQSLGIYHPGVRYWLG